MKIIYLSKVKKEGLNDIIEVTSINLFGYKLKRTVLVTPYYGEVVPYFASTGERLNRIHDETIKTFVRSEMLFWEIK